LCAAVRRERDGPAAVVVGIVLVLVLGALAHGVPDAPSPWHGAERLEGSGRAVGVGVVRGGTAAGERAREDGGAVGFRVGCAPAGSRSLLVG
jgi:hypothetical protein